MPRFTVLCVLFWWATCVAPRLSEGSLSPAARRRLERGKASRTLWVDVLRADSEWRHYKFPAPTKRPGILTGPPTTKSGGPLFLFVRGIDANGFWYKLVRPCHYDEQSDLQEEEIPVLVSSPFQTLDGGGRRLWRSRVVKPGADPYQDERAQGPLAFEILKQQRLTFLQLLYFDQLPDFPAEFRGSPLESRIQEESPEEKGQTNTCPSHFSPFGARGGGQPFPVDSTELPGSPVYFQADLLRDVSQFKGHRVASGRLRLPSFPESPKGGTAVVSFPSATFANPPHVFVQLRSADEPLMGFSRLLEVTKDHAVVLIHPHTCTALQTPQMPFVELDWMAWEAIF